MYIQHRHAQTDCPSSYWSHTDWTWSWSRWSYSLETTESWDCWAAAASQPEVNVSTLQLHFIFSLKM